MITEVDTSPPAKNPSATIPTALQSCPPTSSAVAAVPSHPSAMAYQGNALDHDPAMDSGDESDSSQASVATTVFRQALEVVTKKLQRLKGSPKDSASPLQTSLPTASSAQSGDHNYCRGDAFSKRTARSNSVTAPSGLLANRHGRRSYSSVSHHSLNRVNRSPFQDPLSAYWSSSSSSVGLVERLPRRSHSVDTCEEDCASSVVSAFSSVSCATTSSLSPSQVSSRTDPEDGRSSILYERSVPKQLTGAGEDDAASSVSSVSTLRLRRLPSHASEEDARSSVVSEQSYSPGSVRTTWGGAASSMSSIRRLQGVSGLSRYHKRDSGCSWDYVCDWSKYLILILLVCWVSFKFVSTNLSDVTTCSGTLSFPIQGLGPYLSERVYGQELPVNIVTTQMQRYMHERMKQRTKPLTFSFHGWSGVGKTFMAKQLVSFFHSTEVSYKEYNAYDFEFMNHNGSLDEHVRVTLLRDVSMCHLNIFLLEEVDRYSEQVLRGVIGAMRTITNSPGIPWPPVVIIFIPNMSNGGYTIMERYLDQTASGKRRDAFTQEDFVDTILKEHFYWSQRLRKEGFLDVVVPFLPLEEDHVLSCIQAECLRRDHQCSSEEVKDILDNIDFRPIQNSSVLIPLRGCYRVEKVVVEYLIG